MAEWEDPHPIVKKLSEARLEITSLVEKNGALEAAVKESDARSLLELRQRVRRGRRRERMRTRGL